MNCYEVKRLEGQWFSLCERLEVDYEVATTWWNSIRNAYGHEDRHYHNLEHLSKILDAVNSRFEAYRAHFLSTDNDLDLVLLAAWFHDFIYRFDGKVDNEQESATVAKQWAFVNTNLSKDDCNFVYNLIMATKHQELYGDDLGRLPCAAALLCDSDVITMAADWDYFAETNENIRKENSRFTDEEWSVGREGFFRAFLARGGVFSLSIKDEEQRARRNIEMLLQGSN